jgi:hypothetical protein
MTTNDDYRAEREAHPECVEMTIRSRVPSKWRFVDLETGDVWQWRDGTFERARIASAEREIARLQEHLG